MRVIKYSYVADTTVANVGLSIIICRCLGFNLSGSYFVEQLQKQAYVVDSYILMSQVFLEIYIHIITYCDLEHEGR